MVGLIVGKFYPYHKGHQFLVNTALNECTKVIVLQCLEPWMDSRRTTDINNENVIELQFPYSEELKYQYSDDDEQVSKEWALAIKKFLFVRGINVDKVFGSDLYIENFSKHLGADFCIVDSERENYKISATKIRNSLIKNWDFVVNKRKWQKIIVFWGTEGIGKTTHVQQMQMKFGELYSYVYEFGRTLAKKATEMNYEDYVTILNGHYNLLKKAIEEDKPVIFSDTDFVTTYSYMRFMYGEIGIPDFDEIVDRYSQNIKTEYRGLYKDKFLDDGKDSTRLPLEDRILLQHHHEYYHNKLKPKL